ncbi:hypothetical protein H5410_021171 [Solanum commersonii]|uniref:Uncharacterized protein n=1 Tax=Solanum commersonii TaxID=4109 RepID=A0A9J5ZB72_SOLCO|nr:hypothetical protein H5410_021171 [Solanum commersonii]
MDKRIMEGSFSMAGDSNATSRCRGKFAMDQTKTLEQVKEGDSGSSIWSSDLLYLPGQEVDPQGFTLSSINSFSLATASIVGVKIESTHYLFLGTVDSPGSVLVPLMEHLRHLKRWNPWHYKHHLIWLFRQVEVEDLEERTNTENCYKLVGYPPRKSYGDSNNSEGWRNNGNSEGWRRNANNSDNWRKDQSLVENHANVASSSKDIGGNHFHKQYKQILGLLNRDTKDHHHANMAGIDEWIIDSGATHHFTGNKELLQDCINIDTTLISNCDATMSTDEDDHLLPSSPSPTEMRDPTNIERSVDIVTNIESRSIIAPSDVDTEMLWFLVMLEDPQEECLENPFGCKIMLAHLSPGLLQH